MICDSWSVIKKYLVSRLAIGLGFLLVLWSRLGLGIFESYELRLTQCFTVITPEVKQSIIEVKKFQQDGRNLRTAGYPLVLSACWVRRLSAFEVNRCSEMWRKVALKSRLTVRNIKWREVIQVMQLGISSHTQLPHMMSQTLTHFLKPVQITLPRDRRSGHVQAHPTMEHTGDGVAGGHATPRCENQKTHGRRQSVAVTPVTVMLVTLRLIVG